MAKKNLPYSESIDVSIDDRGTFVNFLSNADKRSDSGLSIKRIYYVYNHAPGIVRGFHYHKREWKYFIIVSGAAKIVGVDPKKPKEMFTFVTSERKPNLVVIPPGYANGWVSLQKNTILVCGSTSTKQESIVDDKRIDPYKWGDIWTVKGR